MGAGARATLPGMVPGVLVAAGQETKGRPVERAGSLVCLGMPFMSLQMRKKRKGIGQGTEGLTQLSGKKKEPHKVWLFYQTRQARGSGATRRAGCYIDGGCAATVAA